MGSMTICVGAEIENDDLRGRADREDKSIKTDIYMNISSQKMKRKNKTKNISFNKNLQIQRIFKRQIPITLTQRKTCM